MATIGIEWVNQYHGRARDLDKCDDDAKGFYNTLDGVKQFEYGDDNAWDQDFEESGVGSPTAGTDQSYADNVDIVFFAGHSNPNGALFGIADKDDGRAWYDNMRLGNRQCEWIAFASCRLLNNDDGNVFNRWGPVFKGLHYILGFETNCSDRGDHGRKFAEKLNAGETVYNAWKKACEETEASDTCWANMHAEQDSIPTNVWQDHWWGKGYVSPDPVNPSNWWWCHGPC